MEEKKEPCDELAAGSSRREFLATAAAVPLLAAGPSGAAAGKGNAASRPVVISSKNGLPAIPAAYRMLAAGKDPVDAVVAAVSQVEDDPNEVSVGYGGIPNEEGVVELDASVMDGATMRAGAVAALHNIKNPSQVARLVLRKTTRILLVGEGALRFARAQGFKEQDLLTERARKIWLYWKENLSQRDDWIPGAREAEDPDIRWFIERYGDADFRPQGTIHCSAVGRKGELAGVTTTSGLFFKMPGRVGDSPIIGAGLYTDGEIGSAGSTGWGEGNIRVVGAHTILELIRQGKSPEEACLATLKRVVDLAREQKRDDQGRPLFSLSYYVVTRDGRYAGAAVWSGVKKPSGEITREQFAVCDERGARLENSAYLYKRD